MRCRACDSIHGRKFGDDFYCTACRNEIMTTIKEDREKYENDEAFGDSPELPTLRPSEMLNSVREWELLPQREQVVSRPSLRDEES